MSVSFFGCNSGGGGGGGGSTPPPNLSQDVNGGSVKGPLANADVAFYQVDPTYTNFQASTASATGTTNAQAKFVGITLGGVGVAPKPPYIVVFTARDANPDTNDPGTIDLTTGKAPVVKTMRTVVTKEKLSSGKPIYATVLSTMTVDIAIANALSGVAPYNTPEILSATKTADRFVASLPIAKEQVRNSFGFGLTSDVDILDTPPILDENVTAADAAKVAKMRQSTETAAAVLYEMSKRTAGASTDDVLKQITDDMTDGKVDGVTRSGASTDKDILSDAVLDVLNQDTNALIIPDTNKVVTDVEAILSQETVDTGLDASQNADLTTIQTELNNGTIDAGATTQADTNPDRDGDGVYNNDDAFPDDPNETKDSDNDGIGDNSDPDRDGDGVLNEYDFAPDDANVSVDPNAPIGASDADGDGVPDASDNCVNAYNPNQTNTDLTNETNNLLPIEGDACDTDIDGDGVLNSADKFPFNANESVDTDGDGVGNNADLDDDNDGVPDSVEISNGTNPLLADTDGDGRNDLNDKCPTDPNDWLDSDKDGICDNADTDADNDGVPNASDAFPNDPRADTDTDGDGIADDVYTVTDATTNPVTRGAVNVTLSDPDDDNDGLPDVKETNTGIFVDANNTGTNPKNPDSDGDGLNDRVETGTGVYVGVLNTGTDPNKADSDNDGLSDKVETNSGIFVDLNNTGTDPNKADTDNDGLKDGVESNSGTFVDNTDTGTNPLVADTDQDGLSDGVESNSGTFVGATDTGTNPLVADTDGDGLSDAVETNSGIYVGANDTGSSPVNADSDGDGISDGVEVSSGTSPINSDTDGDTIADNIDNCPLVANTNQTDNNQNGIGDACEVDTDQDGIIDPLDNCPLVPNADQANLDNDSMGDVCDDDIDGDTFANANDAFPMDPTEWADSDGDGVGDNADVCPNDPSTSTDPSVCPATASITSILNAGIYYLDSRVDSNGGAVNFAYGSLVWNGSATTFTDYKYDQASSSWILSTEPPRMAVMLGAAGWAQVNEQEQVANVNNTNKTFNMVVKDVSGNTYKDSLITISNNKVVSAIALTTEVSANDEANWNKALKPGAVFSASTSRYVITSSQVTDAYRLYCEGGDPRTDTQDGCFGIEIAQDVGGNPILATQLTDVMVPTSNGGTTVTMWIGQLAADPSCYINAELVGSSATSGSTGTANYYQYCNGGAPTSLGQSSAWSVVTVNNIDILETTIPDLVFNTLDTMNGDQNKLRLASIYNGYVRYGSMSPAGPDTNVPPVLVNLAAMNDMLANFDSLGLFPSPVSMANVLPTASGGFYDFDSNSYTDMGGNPIVEYRYSTIIDSGSSIAESNFIFDGGQKLWLTDNSSKSEFWLSPAAGWASEASKSVTIYNANGSADVAIKSANSDVLATLNIMSGASDISGRKVSDMPLPNGFYAAYDPAAVFPASSTAYVNTLTYVADAYQLFCNGDPQLSTGDGCGGVMYSVDVGGNPMLAATLAQILVPSSDPTVPNSKWVGEVNEGGVMLELIGTTANSGDSGNANFIVQPYMGGAAYTLADTSTWAVSTVNGVDILKVTIPDSLFNMMRNRAGKDVIYSVQGNYVRPGRYSPAGSTGSDGRFVSYNPTAGAFLVNTNNFNPPVTAPDTDGDGVPDANDICPTVFNPNQDPTDNNLNSIPDECEGMQSLNLSTYMAQDSDGDGVADNLDAFPTDPNQQMDTDGDGIGDGVDTDIDGDGVLNGNDPCPYVNGASACDASGIIGAHQLNWSITSLVPTTEPEAGFCFGTDQVGGTGTEILPMSDGVNGVVLINGDSYAYYDSGAGHLTGTWSHTRNQFDSMGNPHTVTETSSIDLTFSAGNWSGTYSETLTGNGVNCSRSESVAGSMLYQPNGSENYSGVYGMEVVVNHFDPNTGMNQSEQDTHAAQLEFDSVAGKFHFHDADGYHNELESFYDPVSGAIHYVGYSEKVYDRDMDGNNDLVQDVLTIDAVLVQPSSISGSADMYMRVRGGTLVYSNQIAYSGQNASFSDGNFDAKGYGQIVQPGGNNIVRTEFSNGALTDIDMMTLWNPWSKRTTQGSHLVYAVHPGTVADSANVICASDMDSDYQYRADLPRPTTPGMLNGSTYAQINCKMATGSITQGANYTLAVWEHSNATATDLTNATLVGQVVYTTVAREAAPGSIPNRANVTFDLAHASKTETGAIVPIAGFFNPMTGGQVSWPAFSANGLNADQYLLHIYPFDINSGQRENKQKRYTINGGATSVTIGADANIRGPHQVILQTRIANGSLKAHALARPLLLMPGINGVVNVDVVNPTTTAALLLQMELQTDDKGSVKCGMINHPEFNCASINNVVDYVSNKVVLEVTDDANGGITGTPNQLFDLTMQFATPNDGLNATVTMNANAWQGVAKVVTTEMIARTRIRANGTVSTQFVLANPLPSYDMATLNSTTADLTGGAVTSLTIWDLNPGTGFVDSVNSFVQTPLNGVAVQTNGMYWSYDSNNYTLGALADEAYTMQLTGNSTGAALMPSRTFKVNYVQDLTANTYKGPGLAAMTVNGTSASGTSFASPIALAGTVLTINWTIPGTSTSVDNTTTWRVVAQRAIDANTTEMHRDLRTAGMLVGGDARLTNDGAGNWTFDDSVNGEYDLANMFVTSEVVKLILFADNPNGNVRSISGAVYVTMP